MQTAHVIEAIARDDSGGAMKADRFSGPFDPVKATNQPPGFAPTRHDYLLPESVESLRKPIFWIAGSTNRSASLIEHL